MLILALTRIFFIWRTIMVKHSIITLSFIFICIFSTQKVNAIWWWLSATQEINQTLPDISTALFNEFNRILDPASQNTALKTAIEALKNKRIPAIMQEAEYQHASKPFKNNAALLGYAFNLARSASLDFYATQIDRYCAQKLSHNPPYNPESVDMNSMRRNCVRYLYDNAFQELSSKNGTLANKLKTIEADVVYAIHLALKYGSPIW